MKAYLYARVSSREQEREGYSIPAQKILLHDYAVAKGFTVVSEFIDVETAKSPGRKEFGKMMRLLQNDASCRVVLVEKTDRLYRNAADTYRFGELIETRNVELHLVKEGMVVSKDSRSHEKFMHDIKVAISKLYVDNLREEVVKGMTEKAREGFYPGRAAFGYRHDTATRTIVLDSVKAPIVVRMFEAYEYGDCSSLLAVRDLVHEKFGVKMPKSQVHNILRNPFYTGVFYWKGERHQGHHPPIITPERFRRVQDALDGKGHPKHQHKHNFAFGGGLIRCTLCGCTVTAEIKKGRYVYYRCSFGKGKCTLPYMPESKVSEKLGDVLKGIYVPEQVVSAVVQAIRGDSDGAEKRRQEQLVRLQQRLAVLRTRRDKMYEDKLDGRIDGEFWRTKNAELCEQEATLASELGNLSSPVSSDQRALTAQRILELAHKAHFLYLTRNSAERAQLLKIVLSNCSTNGTSFVPTYRKPFDAIFERAKNENWLGRLDSNQHRPH